MADMEVVVGTINADLAILAVEATKDYVESLGELLVRARAVLTTAYIDTPQDLLKPERQEVILRLVQDINKALKLETTT